jgi:hypothetical protein
MHKHSTFSFTLLEGWPKLWGFSLWYEDCPSSKYLAYPGALLLQCARRAATQVDERRSRWTLRGSEFFSKRKHETESRDLADSFQSFARQFECAWSRVVSKPRFVRMIGNSDRSSLAGDRQELERGAPLFFPWVAGSHSL